MTDRDRGGLEDRLLAHDRVLEVGIGDRPGLATRLARAGVAVVAVDIARCEPPPAVGFIRADVHSLDPGRVRPIDAVYARRLPPELHRPVAELADALGADCYFTTVGGELPTVPVRTVTGPDETVYVRPAESDMVL